MCSILTNGTRVFCFRRPAYPSRTSTIMVMLPLENLGGMLVRFLTKPIANELKTLGKSHPRLKAACTSLGQRIHRWNVVSHVQVASMTRVSIRVKDLPDDQALQRGTEFIGEVFIFAVAVAVITYDFTRSTAKATAKDAAMLEKEFDDFLAMEARFRRLETALHRQKHDVQHLQGVMAEHGKTNSL
ncbi:hypothetical protein SDRG_09259 [Saprolegnia diclina VS20]|uniref:OPA3-like protein n=1 Tax=Saprolegnia diclina (strain VS20) TaxID=1156394 RepID=T0RSS7_SAPDV|nr:hypothetical protein SDRG_09259 [Saprolegnia diclina VS20]EQC33277.1 hypothetical protein SDRG_09259 [Saprolegnia diclina VS20]|eukprot:XP_008613400.1 hypothetical protein SDRG_09259 [Saprolegnia diclina VS20]